MTSQEVTILNSLVTYAMENMPGELRPDEREVAYMVGRWALDGMPVHQVCPHCGAPTPRGEGRVEFLQEHLDNNLHRSWWWLKHKLTF